MSSVTKCDIGLGTASCVHNSFRCTGINFWWRLSTFEISLFCSLSCLSSRFSYTLISITYSIHAYIYVWKIRLLFSTVDCLTKSEILNGSLFCVFSGKTKTTIRDWGQTPRAGWSYSAASASEGKYVTVFKPEDYGIDVRRNYKDFKDSPSLFDMHMTHVCDFVIFWQSLYILNYKVKMHTVPVKSLDTLFKFF